LNTEEIEIPARFCGPPASGNGGYVCGRVARGLPGTVAVRLKAPPPLDTVLRREWSAGSARLLQGQAVIGEGQVSDVEFEAPAPPRLAQAEQAARHYPGFKSHLFPRCFVCGPARGVGDGLRIFAGPLADGVSYAAPWVPDRSLAAEDGRVAPEFVWAALDCPSAFTLMPLPEGTAIVLGELCARLWGTLDVGEPAIVSAWPIARTGRRRTAGTAIHTPAGELVAVARATWVEVPLSQWTPAPPAGA
jgi:hypothetical protein